MPDLASLRFLDPTAALLAMAIGLPVLLLFYFLKLRRRPVRVSSAMIWRDAARDMQVNVPWRLLRPSWLLLLQLLILALLAGALGRPVLDLAAEPPRRIVIVIDHSASMGAHAESDADTRLDDAKSGAKALLSRIADGSSQSVFSIVSSASRAVVRYSEGIDAGAASAAIDAIEPTDEPGDLEPLFQLLKAMTASAVSDSETPSGQIPARVVLFSDAGDAERLRTGGGGSSAMSGLGDVEFEFIRVGEPPDGSTPVNAGIVALSARRDYDDPSLVRVFCAIEHNADRARSVALRALLTLPASTETIEIGAWGLDLPRASSDGPGRTTRSFDLIAPSGGTLEIRLIASDALGSDNAAWIILDTPAPPTVWLVRSDDATPTAAGASLLDAIEAVIGAPPRVMNAAEFESITAGESPPDVIIFDAVRPARLPPVPTLSFGAGLPIPGLIIETPESPRATQVAFWTRSDPLMRGVTFAGTIITNPRRVTLPDTEASGSAVRSARVVARGADGPLIADLRDSARRIILSFTLDETNWWKEPSFPVFMANAIELLAGAGDANVGGGDQRNGGGAGRIVQTGKALELAWPGPASEVVVTGPDGFERRITSSGDGVLALGSLPRAGLYRVGDAVTVAASLLDPVESSLATRDTISIAGRSVASTAVARIAPREIWWWFVLAAVALLAIEWWVYALRMRT